MSLPRRISLVVLMLCATAWAAVWVMLGLWLILDGPRQAPLPAAASLSAGLCAVSAGLIVFMCFVADRLFPAVGRRLSMWRIEMGTVLAFLIGGGLAILLSWGA